MAVVADDVRELSLSGEFDSLTDGQIETRIDLAESVVNREAWDQASNGGIDRGDDGVKFLAAHYLAEDMRSTTAAAGPVTAEAAGGMSRSYASPSKITLSEAALMRTIYGRRHLELRRSLCITPLTVNTSQGGLYNG